MPGRPQSGLAAGIDVLCDGLKDLVTKCRLTVDVLQAREDRNDLVATARIERNVGDDSVTESKLGIEGVAHGELFRRMDRLNTVYHGNEHFSSINTRNLIDLREENHLPNPENIRLSASYPTDTVIRQVAKEHIEAVVGEVMQIWRENPNRRDTLVAINPRRIAVILDKQANRGAVLPVQSIERVLDGSMRTNLQTWLESPQSRFYVMYLPGSWFVSREIESRRSKSVEPTFVRTNMTHDPGRRPKE